MHEKEKIGLELLKQRAIRTGYQRKEYQVRDMSPEEEEVFAHRKLTLIGMLDKGERWSREKEESFQLKRKIEAQYRQHGCRECRVDLFSDRTIGGTRRSDTYGCFLVEASVDKHGTTKMKTIRDLA